MSAKIEKKAIDYLINELKSLQFKFEKANRNSGFDLRMVNIQTKETTDIELKATEKQHKKNMEIGNIVFSTKKEAELFESGKTKILRLFLGDNPPKLFIFDNNILSNGAEVKPEYRSTIKGKRDYSKVKQINN